MLEGKKADIRAGSEFAKAPADKYTVQVIDVKFKMKTKYKSTEEEEVLNYQFAILDDKAIPESDQTTRGCYLWKDMVQTLHKKAWLGKFAIALYGRELTKDEMDGFDPEAYVGRQICVMTENNWNKDNTVEYSNIISFSPVSEKLEEWMEVAPGGKMVEKETETVVEEDLDTVPVKGELPGSTEEFDKIFPGKEEEEIADDVAALKAKLKAAEAKEAKAKPKTKKK